MAHTRSKLEHSLSLLKATLDATTDAILVVDAAGRVMQYNTEFARMWQIDRELLNADTQSAPLRRILNGTDLQDDAETRWFEVRRDPERHAYDELLLSDGRIIERHQMTEYRDGIAVGQIWHFRDITERKASETPLAQLSFGMDQMRDAAYLIDNDARIIYANRHACLELGYSREQLRGMRVEDIDPAHTDTIWRTHWQALKASGSLTLETLHQTKDGRLFPVEVVANFFEYANTGYNLAIARNISERKRIEEVLQQAALIYQNSSEAMLLADAEGRIIAVNPAFTQITGHCREEIEGQSIDLINTEDHRKAMWQSVRKSGFWQGEVWDRTQSGDRYAKWLTVNAIKDSAGQIFRLVALFADITEKKQAENLIWQQANIDPLTQLPNRRMFHDRLEQEIKKAGRDKTRLALFFIDLDLFKEVNDTLGHDMGDKLLQTAAQRIRLCVRDSDTVARLGGDEFTVILREVGEPCNVERIAGAILEKMAERFELGADVAHISTSIGIAFYPDDARDIKSLLKHADQAMYVAKNRGRNQYCFFIPAMQEAARHRLGLSKDLRSALSTRQLTVYYQPIVELSSNRVCKAEALIRWHHPQRGLIGPSEFIPIAEETGLINTIGNWLFEQAAQQARKWRLSIHDDFQISINKSSVQFRNERENHQAWLEKLTELQLSGQHIVVEITEGVLLESGNRFQDQLSSFRNAGIQISLDDFGTGYSSLSYLKKYDIDYLKIDQECVNNLSADPANLALCEAIILMAHKLGIRVIAEGIESEAQRQLLKNADCDFGQGFFFAKPLSADLFESRFSEQT